MKNLTAFLLAAFLPLCALAQVKDGDAAPDFKFKTPDGTEYTMASFKGKLVFIDVWATWCPPCRAEIPALKALEKTFEGQDVVIKASRHGKNSYANNRSAACSCMPDRKARVLFPRSTG